MHLMEIGGTFNAEKAPMLGGFLFYDKSRGDLDSGEIVILMGGFARVATREDLLLTIAKKLNKPSFVFDWHGLGLSKGDFGDVTVERLADDLKRVVSIFVSEGFSRFHLIGHSLGACIIQRFYRQSYVNICKRILISPALNQNFLLRYWFAKKRGYDFNFEKWTEARSKKTFWQAMTDYGKDNFYSAYWLHEDEFKRFIEEEKEINGVKIKSDYWHEEKNNCYEPSEHFSSRGEVSGDKILHIHGEKDTTVPYESIEFKFENSRIFKGADHYFLKHEDKVASVVSEFIG